MTSCSRRPLMVVNIYVNQNQKSQLPIYAQKPFKWSVRQFAKQHHLKDKAIPYIKDIILSQMKKNKIDISQFDQREDCQNQMTRIRKPKRSTKMQQKCKIQRVTQLSNDQINNRSRTINIARLKSKHTSSLYINQGSTQMCSDIQNLSRRMPLTCRNIQSSRSINKSMKNACNLKKIKSMKSINSKKLIQKNSKDKIAKSKSKSKKSLKTANIKVFKPKTLTQTEDSTVAISSRLTKSKQQFQITCEKSVQSESSNSSLVPINASKDKKQQQISKSDQKDLQYRMAQQIKQVQIRKLVSKHQQAILGLYQKLIRNNPPSIRRIHADYISFQQITQEQLLCLQNFFENMDHNELNQLTFGNFLNLLVKYSAEDLVFSLSESGLR